MHNNGNAYCNYNYINTHFVRIATLATYGHTNALYAFWKEHEPPLVDNPACRVYITYNRERKEANKTRCNVALLARV